MISEGDRLTSAFLGRPAIVQQRRRGTFDVNERIRIRCNSLAFERLDRALRVAPYPAAQWCSGAVRRGDYLEHAISPRRRHSGRVQGKRSGLLLLRRSQLGWSGYASAGHQTDDGKGKVCFHHLSSKRLQQPRGVNVCNGRGCWLQPRRLQSARRGVRCRCRQYFGSCHKAPRRGITEIGERHEALPLVL